MIFDRYLGVPEVLLADYDKPCEAAKEYTAGVHPDFHYMIIPATTLRDVCHKKMKVETNSQSYTTDIASLSVKGQGSDTLAQVVAFLCTCAQHLKRLMDDHRIEYGGCWID